MCFRCALILTAWHFGAACKTMNNNWCSDSSGSWLPLLVEWIHVAKQRSCWSFLGYSWLKFRCEYVIFVCVWHGQVLYRTIWYQNSPYRAEFGMSVIERRREPHIEIVVMIINHEFDEALFWFQKIYNSVCGYPPSSKRTPRYVRKSKGILSVRIRENMGPP